MQPIFPDLEAIDKTEDLNVQFYAAIGAATSLAAALERELFTAYLAASGLESPAAAEIFYRHITFAHKRNTADKAIREAISTFDIALDWPKILEQLNGLCGDGTARNLIGHNVVRQQVTSRLIDDAVDVFVANYVEQNEHLVAAAKRPAQKATYANLFTYCQDADVCLSRLRYVGSQLRKARSPSA